MARKKFNASSIASARGETNAGKLGTPVDTSSLTDVVKGPVQMTDAGDIAYMSPQATKVFAMMTAGGASDAEILAGIREVNSGDAGERAAKRESQTAKYLAAFQESGSTGKPLEDILDSESITAMKRMMGNASNGAGQNIARMVPSVTEIENGRERGYDLYSLLIKKRIVLLEGQVDDTMASIANASLLYLDSGVGSNPDDAVESKSKPITIYVNSPGGSVLAGLSMYDTIRNLKTPVKTIGMGMQASMGSILLVSGDERKMTTNSYFMVHQPLSGNERSTQQTDIRIGSDFTTRLREQLTEIYVAHTGLKHEFWDIVLERDTWLSAQNAKDMGVITDIVGPPANKKAPHAEFAKRADPIARAKVPKTAEGIMRVINTDKAADIRPELVVALSKFEEFWTPSRKAQEDAAKLKAKAAAKATAKAPANDVAEGPAASAPKSTKLDDSEGPSASARTVKSRKATGPTA